MSSTRTREIQYLQISEHRGKQKGKELVLLDKPAQANSVRSNPSPNTWLLDTAATWNMTQNRHDFLTYQEVAKEKPVHDTGNHSHHVVGIGIVKLNIPGGAIKAWDVRHIPGIHASLLSFSLLEAQAFDISLVSTVPEHFQVTFSDNLLFRIYANCGLITSPMTECCDGLRILFCGLLVHCKATRGSLAVGISRSNASFHSLR